MKLHVKFDNEEFTLLPMPEINIMACVGCIDVERFDDSLPESKQKINRALIVYKSWLRSRREWFETEKERLDFEEFNNNHISELNEKFKNSTKIEMYISDDEFWNEILDRKLNESS